MPNIKIKSTEKLTRDQKEDIANKLERAFAESSNAHVAGNIQFIIEGECFIHFRGDSKGPSAHIEIHPGPLTPEADYAKIIDAFFPVLVQQLHTPQDRIYITISEVKFWGFNGELVNIEKYKINM